jgi:mRNA interferase RelE/StbE
VPYEVRFKDSAAAAVEKLPEPARRRVIARAEALAEDPRPRDAVKLKVAEDTHRVRVGDYRIIYRIEEARLVVLVIRIGHRREVYRGL